MRRESIVNALDFASNLQDCHHWHFSFGWARLGSWHTEGIIVILGVWVHSKFQIVLLHEPYSALAEVQVRQPELGITTDTLGPRVLTPHVGR